MPKVRSVAIVEDDANFREALVALLDTLGFKAFDFGSAEDFLIGPTPDLVDCVITDIHMPGMTGFDLQRLLGFRRAKLPTIVITARPEPGLEAKAVALGATCVLIKPFKAEDLQTCLEAAFARGRRP